MHRLYTRIITPVTHMVSGLPAFAISVLPFDTSLFLLRIRNASFSSLLNRSVRLWFTPTLRNASREKVQSKGKSSAIAFPIEFR